MHIFSSLWLAVVLFVFSSFHSSHQKLQSLKELSVTEHDIFCWLAKCFILEIKQRVCFKHLLGYYRQFHFSICSPKVSGLKEMKLSEVQHLPSQIQLYVQKSSILFSTENFINVHTKTVNYLIVLGATKWYEGCTAPNGKFRFSQPTATSTAVTSSKFDQGLKTISDQALS